MLSYVYFIFAAMRLLVVIVAILIGCNRNSNIEGPRTNLSRLSKMEREDLFGRVKFDSVTIDSAFEDEPVYRRAFYDSTKTLRLITEVINEDTVQVYYVHFRNDSLFLLRHLIYDSSGVISLVKYFFENNKCDTLGNKNLMKHPSHYIEVSNDLYKMYRKLNK
jgi:hypothetical protein